MDDKMKYKYQTFSAWIRNGYESEEEREKKIYLFFSLYYN